MKRRWIFALAALFAFAACAGETEQTDDAEPAASAAEETAPAMDSDPDIAPEGEPAALPAGYAVRLDQPTAGTEDYRVTQQDGGLHVRTGPAGILYDEADAVESGDYSVSATFTEIGAPPNHREAFGLIIGGSDLQGEAQRYTYFLVRADGRYIIKRRDGGETPGISDGWVDSDAVNGAAEGGDVTNTLAIEIRGDQAHFSVNGTEVATHPVSELDAYGIAGVRINHNLDVRVEGFQLSS